MVELVIAWMGRVWAKKNSNWAETHFWKSCSDFLGKENAQKRMPFCHASTFFIFLTILLHVGGFWEQLEFFLCFFIPRFWWLASFFPWIGGHFCSAGDWVVFLTFWSYWCIFHSRFWKFHVFLPWRWRAIHVFYCLSNYWPHAQAIWGIFPLLWVGFPDKLQDRVFFPMLWAIFAVMYGAV